MEEKWDIHTIFRLVLPAFISICVIYSFVGEFPSKDCILGITFFSVPVGYIFLTIYRGWYKYCGFQEKLTGRDTDYMLNVKHLMPKQGGMPEELIWQRNYYYASTVDFVIDTDDGIGKLSSKIRFLYTQMHAFGAIATAVIVTDIGCSIFYPFNSHWYLSLIWLFICILMIYLMNDLSDRIFVWRTILIDNYKDHIQNLLSGSLNRSYFK